MKLGFIIPNYPNEKRVALLPEDIKNLKNEIFIEKNFGKNLDISDEEYIKKGIKILSRKEIFQECEAIFSLKLIQESDYDSIREGQTIIGWTHPTGSGKKFMKLAKKKKLKVMDLDNVYPSLYYGDSVYSLNMLPRDFIRKNSLIAGMSATLHAIQSKGEIPTSKTKIAILSAGNVAQGAYQIISKFNCDVRMFTKSNMYQFKENLFEFDMIINGIETVGNNHILSKFEQNKLKKGCFIIDAAADAGGAIEGSEYTSLDNPIYRKNRIYYYVVNNAPSVFYRDSSKEISKSFSKWIYSKEINYFLGQINE